MRIISVIVSLILSVTICHAQSPFRQFVLDPSGHELSCRFSYATRDDIPLKGSGRVWISGDCFEVHCNGLTVLCDGSTRWTIDEDAKEVYAESSEDISDFLDDPSLLIQQLTSVKETSDGISGVYVFEDQEIDLRFFSMTLYPAGEMKKSFNPEKDLKDYISKGFVLNDLR